MAAVMVGSTVAFASGTAGAAPGDAEAGATIETAGTSLHLQLVGAEIDQVKVSLKSSADGAPYATVGGFVAMDPPSGWAVDTPFSIADHAGVNWAEFTYVRRGVTKTATSKFFARYGSEFQALTAEPRKLDYDHRKFLLTGKLVRFATKTGPRTPLGGTTVSGFGGSAVTAQDGTFSYQATSIGHLLESLQTATSDTVYKAGEARYHEVNPNAVPPIENVTQATKFNAKVTFPKDKDGKAIHSPGTEVTVSGDLTRTTPTGPKPAPAEPINLRHGDNFLDQTTGASGAFEFKFKLGDAASIKLTYDAFQFGSFLQDTSTSIDVAAAAAAQPTTTPAPTPTPTPTPPGPKPVKRLSTRFVRVNAGPEPVRKGRKLTVRGTLQAKNGNAWKALGKHRVYVWFKAKGAKKWTRVAVLNTNSKGLIIKGFKAKKDGSWRLSFTADRKFSGTVSGWDYVDVR